MAMTSVEFSIQIKNLTLKLHRLMFVDYLQNMNSKEVKEEV
jgi:hypothetical protein